MKKILFAGVASLALIGVAAAADLPRKAPVFKAPPAPVYDWNGFYLGGYYGTSLSHSRASTAVVPGDVELNDGGITVGGTIGYNIQFNPNWLIGIEGDIGYLNTKREFDDFDNFNRTGHFGVKSTWYSTFRGRLGYVTGPSLLYVTGGGAAVRLEERYGSPAVQTVLKTTDTGWTVGGGIETELTSRWSARLEYLYMNLGTSTLDDSVSLGAPLHIDYKNRFQVVRAGLSYKFGGPDVVPARY
jgi:outer membrane immunogenic protein